MPTTVEVEVVKNGTNVRRGGSTKGKPDNVVGVIDRGTYQARVQCAGEEIVEGNVRNFWWVQLETPVGVGWVSAVRVAGGVNDGEIPGVPTGRTVFGDPAS